jgi:Lon protease-like protein
MEQLLALFPLHTVLFPGSTASLQIHEERYKQMIGRCMAMKEPFGIVLIREGEEVCEPAEPYEVGTTATITTGVRFNDGNLLIAVEGGARFRILHTIQTRPYILASVELIEDEVTIEQRTDAERLRKLYERYRQSIALATGVVQPLDDLPPDPVAMSFHLSALLQVPYLSKQQLLEAELDTRLEALLAALAEELRYLPPPSDTSIPTGNRWSVN